MTRIGVTVKVFTCSANTVLSSKKEMIELKDTGLAAGQNMTYSYLNNFSTSIAKCSTLSLSITQGGLPAALDAASLAQLSLDSNSNL
jgi:hypothetical protein